MNEKVMQMHYLLWCVLENIQITQR